MEISRMHLKNKEKATNACFICNRISKKCLGNVSYHHLLVQSMIFNQQARFGNFFNKK